MADRICRLVLACGLAISLGPILIDCCDPHEIVQCCVRSHTNYILMPVVVGKAVIMQLHPVVTCDERRAMTCEECNAR